VLIELSHTKAISRMTDTISKLVNGGDSSDDKKQIILNTFVMNTPGHLAPGLWKHPRNKTDQYKKLSFWTDLAQLLDTDPPQRKVL
jgi:hypothetical protein